MDFEHKVGALDDEDLVVGEKDEKNWKGIVISLLVIGSIMGAIVVAITLCTINSDVDANRMKLELDHVISDAYKPFEFTGGWLSSHEIVYVDQNGSIVIFDAQLNKSSSILVKTHDKTLHTMGGFKLSPDRQSILFVSDVRHEFGQRVSAKYAIFNISTQTVEFLDDLFRSHSAAAAAASPAASPSVPGAGGIPTRHQQQPQIQWANWGAERDSIVLIESNDIYVIRGFRRQSGAGTNLLRLTKTGAYSDSKHNGLPDSLYRANFFKGSPDEAALWWSPDGRYLAYLSFDDAEVAQIPIEHYDSYMHETDTYPKIHYERYPRAGGLNPSVSVHVVELFKGASSEGGGGGANELGAEFESSLIVAPAELVRQQQQDPRMGHYVTYVGWLDSRQLLVMWSNRAQNASILSTCSNPQASTPAYSSSGFFGVGRASVDRVGVGAAGSWKCDVLSSFVHRLPPSVDAHETILSAVDARGQRLVFFSLPRPDSAIGDHYHVALLRGDERAPKYLTHGSFDVDRLLAYDASSDSLYFEAKVSERAERHLYRLSPIGQLQLRHTTCVTCTLAPDEQCAYNQVHLPSMVTPAEPIRFMVHECLGPAVPVTRMRRLTLNHNSTSEFDAQATSLQVLASDKHLEQLVKAKLMPIEKYITVKANSQFPYDVNVKLYLPNESDEEKDKRFPLLVESSELDARNVWKRFELDWGKYLASRKQLVYAKIDSIKPGATSWAGADSRSSSSGAPTSSSSSSSSSGYQSSQLPGLLRQHDEQWASGSRRADGGAAEGSMSSDGPQMSSSSSSDDLEWPLLSAKVQMDVIKFLAENPDLFPFIDKRRVAIWGPTSTSSYLALATNLNDDTKLLQCTIARSPITNWRYMYSYAAEHYFGLPWLDPNTNMKYERSNLLKKTSEFSMRKLLILHGTADEQVHVQNSLQFIKSLTEHHIMGGVIHQMQLYPDVGHSFEHVKRHLYLTLDGFVDRCFYQKPITIKATEWKGKVRPKLY